MTIQIVNIYKFQTSGIVTLAIIITTPLAQNLFPIFINIWGSYNIRKI